MPETSLVLEFDRSLYQQAGVEAAIEAYQDYARDIALTASPESYRVTLTGFDERYTEVIGDSFANHVLFETVIRSRDTLSGVSI